MPQVLTTSITSIHVYVDVWVCMWRCQHIIVATLVNVQTTKSGFRV